VQTKGFWALIRQPIRELIDELESNELEDSPRHGGSGRCGGASEPQSGNQVVHGKGRDEKLEVSRSFSHLFKADVD
jgi:hypothetical protein